MYVDACVSHEVEARKADCPASKPGTPLLITAEILGSITRRPEASVTEITGDAFKTALDPMLWVRLDHLRPG